MKMKIGLLGDIHATAAPLREALQLFEHEGVDTILCVGDVAGYGHELEETVGLLQASGCRTILGNHDLWWLNDAVTTADDPVAAYLRSLPLNIELTVEGKTLHMVHGSPPELLLDGIKLLDEDGVMVLGLRNLWEDYLKAYPYDVLIVGHTHQVFAEQIGKTLLINPGSTRFNHACAMLTLPEMTVEFFPLSGREPVLSWNWAGGTAL